MFLMIITNFKTNTFKDTGTKHISPVSAEAELSCTLCNSLKIVVTLVEGWKLHQVEMVRIGNTLCCQCDIIILLYLLGALNM
jgi:hypothetical protein